MTSERAEGRQEVGFFRGMWAVVRGAFRAVRGVVRLVLKVLGAPLRLLRRRGDPAAPDAGAGTDT